MAELSKEQMFPDLRERLKICQPGLWKATKMSGLYHRSPDQEVKPFTVPRSVLQQLNSSFHNK
jgi:hypothetical protein